MIKQLVPLKENQRDEMLGRLFVGAFKLLFTIIGIGVVISILSVVVVVVKESFGM